MALIGCPECGRELSSSAAACPSCAYPVATGTPPMPHLAVKTPRKREWMLPALSIFTRVGLGFILLIAAVEEESVGSVVGGLLIGGSALPAFVRAWKARLKPARPDTAVADGLADRIRDMEDSHREQLADLEERIDFAERLLTKQREQVSSD